MVLETNKKEQVRGKKVLLFSCGMDCLCVNQIFKPDILLHINYGGKYGEQERQSLQRLINIGAIDKRKVVEYDIGDWLGKRERDDLIIPNRNIFFVTLAAELGETIWLASVKGDRSFDKDEEFYIRMENLLNHVWDTQHWTEKREFRICSPVKHLTKTQLIKKYLECGGKPEWLLTSYSCYEGNTKPCGLCKPCLRKAIALSNCNIEVPKEYFKNDPKKNLEINKMKNNIIRGEYRGDEDKEICKFMEWEYVGK
jgi:7-cyano-7-deazaguanine synthase